ncbi:Predicted DNA binding protein, contains HTH domain [Halobiforma haloterrestris]|uniref:Predicted DNA binding protein, contains HTH domain n=1 Tax=Natronobacterium haloterrestre TaxID=148448 RepID=A0A1I1EAI8_NATHA|nr:helix-turn-helix domain-containing protein [Halobiforma haloterrestris]SFB83736.1 Predicted DNA binding protein, contains HTH domain [Halobiforma haloterrestris]
MKSVRLTLQHGPDTVHPMHRFVADHDAFYRYRLVNWNHANDHNTLIFHVIGDREAYERRIADLETPIAVDVTDGADTVRATEGGDADPFYVYVREEPGDLGERLVEAFSRGSLVPIPPLEYRMDWSVRFGLVGEGEDIRAALEVVPEGIDTTVERVGEYRGGSPGLERLTERQREALRTARNLGYFAVPREASIEAVADELGCAPGTASEHLRKAQDRVMGRLEF